VSAAVAETVRISAAIVTRMFLPFIGLSRNFLSGVISPAFVPKKLASVEPSPAREAAESLGPQNHAPKDKTTSIDVSAFT
jgi:hypothetical protein